MANTRIYIAGGYGLVGSMIARHIRKQYKDVELVLAGRNPEKGEELSQELGNASTAYLDIQNPVMVDKEGKTDFDLIVEALNDPTDRLFYIAHTQGIAHIGITKTANALAPLIARLMLTAPRRPMVQLGHWQSGVLTIAALKAAEQFSHIDTVNIAALYDVLDPIGPMATSDTEDFIGNALLRDNYRWKWVDAAKHLREIRITDEVTVDGYPMGVLDVPSLVSVTGAPNVRFDFAEGQSLGTASGVGASHELYIDIEGILKSGTPGKVRTIVSDPQGGTHLTALGSFVAIERVLGLDGQPEAASKLHFPETLLSLDTAIARFQQFGVRIFNSPL